VAVLVPVPAAVPVPRVEDDDTVPNISRDIVHTPKDDTHTDTDDAPAVISVCESKKDESQPQPVIDRPEPESVESRVHSNTNTNRDTNTNNTPLPDITEEDPEGDEGLLSSSFPRKPSQDSGEFTQLRINI
jgi:hypothetical protein